MATLDTILDDLLESQEHWHRDTMKAGVPVGLAVQPSVAQVLGGLLSASLKRMRL